MFKPKTTISGRFSQVKGSGFEPLTSGLCVKILNSCHIALYYCHISLPLSVFIM